MKVNGSNMRPVSVTGIQETGAAKATGQPASSAQPAAKDRVEITSLSAQLQALESALADLSVVDQARVDAIKQAISEGRFRVDSDVVADQLLATVREYLLARKG